MIAIKTPPECRLIVINEIDGKRSETILPVSPEEAMKSSVEIDRAVRFAHHLDFLEDLRDDTEEPIGVAIHHTDSVVTIRWYGTDHHDLAVDRMADVERGEV